MRRAPIIILFLCLPFLVGWGVTFVKGGGNPFAPLVAPVNLTSIDQCASNVLTPTPGNSAPITLTLTVGANEGLLSIHKGVTGTDPGVTDSFPAQGGAGNVWATDLASDPRNSGISNNGLNSSVNSLSGGCLNVDYVPVSRFTGSDNVTANAPGTGLFNSHILCTIKNFAGIDTSGGTVYQPNNGVGVTLANTGTLTPDVVNSLVLGMYHVETLSSAPSLTGLSSNSTVQVGTPLDQTFTLNSAQSNANMVIGAASEAGISNSILGFQRNFTPLGNFCGGMVALTNAISALSVTPGTATVLAGGTQQFTATATIGGSPPTRNVSPYAVWSSNNTSVATVNANGLATVASGATSGQVAMITGTYNGLSGVSTLTVGGAAGTTFPQFTTNGAITNTCGTDSVYVRSLYAGVPTSVAGGTTGAIAGDFKNAAMTAWETGILYPFMPNDLCSCLSNASGCNAGTCGQRSQPDCGTLNMTCFANAITPIWNNLVTEYNADGLPFVFITDNLWAYPGYNFNNVGFDLNYAQAPQYVNQYVQTHKPVGMMVAQIGKDEFPDNTNNQTPCAESNIINSFGLGFIGNSTCGAPAPAAINISTGPCTANAATINAGKCPHVVWGPDPQFGNVTTSQWLNDPTVSDYALFEATDNGAPPGQTDTGNSFSFFQQSDQAIQNSITTRGATATYIENACQGPGYYKTCAGDQYATCDSLTSTGGGGTGTGSFGESEALIMARAWAAVAHGYAAQRTYKGDWSFANVRHTAAANGSCGPDQLCQTGCSSIPAHNAWTSGGLLLGQDRWYALSAAQNLMKLLDNYILQGAMAPPTVSAVGGCYSLFNNTIANGNSTLVCGAKNGNGGHLVIFVNYSDTALSGVTWDPTPYVFPGGVAQEWKLIGANNYGNASCGPETTIPSVSDCNVGASQIIGSTTVNAWCNDAGCSAATSGAFPTTGMAAPTTAGAALNMAPLEVDVFLYHP